MDKIFADYESLQWWHNTVFWPFLLIFAGWLAWRGLDRLAKKFPESMNQWGNKLHRNFLAMVALLEKHPDAKVLYAMRSVWLRLLALLKLGATSLCFYFAYGGASAPTNWKQWMVFCLGLAFAVSAGNDNSKATTINSAIRRATPVLDELKALE